MSALSSDDNDDVPAATPAGTVVVFGPGYPPQGAQVHRSAQLKDGQRIIIREVRREDCRLIEEGFAGLSSRSRFLRFRGGKARLTEDELDRLTDPEDHDDVALGAVAKGGPGGRSMPVGVARFVRLEPDGDSAELAMTIVDTFQAKGAGTLLLAALARQAEACGVHKLIALVHSENRGMRGLANRFHAAEKHRENGEIEYEFDVADMIEVASRA